MIKLSANLSFLFTQEAFLERFHAASLAGFKGVECLFPYAFPSREIKNRLAASRLEMVMFNAPPGDWAAGARGLAALPGRETDVDAAMEQALAYATTVHCSRVHVMAGIVPVGISRTRAMATLVANLGRAARVFQPHGINILIEPINPFDMPGYLLNRAEEAVEIIERVGADNVRLQYDIYHARRLGVDPLLEIHRFLPAIGHIQIAARRGRGEPDDGDPDTPMIFRLLDRLGYDGWVGLEYTPRAGTTAGLGWAREAGFLSSRG
ncbi:hydroxypyruvate isomerase family protein [Varunaivibrio sulfuroxidans]|uniref:Hydroxypyruvate isomerase n=1 Tax=Varunaivibrio sulfuroxidans TaxID=1773489 RepID=A0A4R3JE25_9PROT|nr:TIM barrel protein [Varunaivibrio sulfuroxidans]TCS64017.1 hydroxypyruvate isomerase [Varunaivibrio sulfuroxidans]WES31531.1 TIM barrel protein [Varunaivibrio sulfuroxidans]